MLTTATRHARANVSCLTRQRRPSGAGLVTAASTRVVKVYYTPGELAARLAELGWSAEIHETSTPLLVGTARRTSDLSWALRGGSGPVLPART